MCVPAFFEFAPFAAYAKYLERYEGDDEVSGEVFHCCSLCCGAVGGCHFDANGPQVEAARFLDALSLRALAFVVLLGSAEFVDFVKRID